MTDLKLKPCPFCEERHDLGVGRLTEDREGWPVYIYCATCGCQGPWKYVDESVISRSIEFIAELTGWNTRASDNRPDPLGEALNSGDGSYRP